MLLYFAQGFSYVCVGVVFAVRCNVVVAIVIALPCLGYVLLIVCVMRVLVQTCCSCFFWFGVCFDLFVVACCFFCWLSSSEMCFVCVLLCSCVVFVFVSGGAFSFSIL